MELAMIKVHGFHTHVCCQREVPKGISGATVRFVYEDDLWKSLNKTVVFKGCVTKDVLNAGEIVPIPKEVVARAGEYLYVGIYGVDDDNNQIIPTLWANLGKIRSAADPSGDPSTDPALPVWAQLQAEIEQLKQGGGSGAGGIMIDEEGYLTTTSGGFVLDDDGYILL